MQRPKGDPMSPLHRIQGENASLLKISSSHLSTKSVGSLPSTFLGRPTMRTLFRCRRFSISSALKSIVLAQPSSDVGLSQKGRQLVFNVADTAFCCCCSLPDFLQVLSDQGDCLLQPSKLFFKWSTEAVHLFTAHSRSARVVCSLPSSPSSVSSDCMSSCTVIAQLSPSSFAPGDLGWHASQFSTVFSAEFWCLLRK